MTFYQRPAGIQEQTRRQSWQKGMWTAVEGAVRSLLKQMDSTWSGVKASSTKTLTQNCFWTNLNWQYIWAQTLAWSGHVVSDLTQEALQSFSVHCRTTASSFLFSFLLPPDSLTFFLEGVVVGIRSPILHSKMEQPKTVEASNIFTGGQYHYMPHQHNIDASGD